MLFVALCVAAAAPNVLFSIGETSHKIKKLYRGCHSDSGFTHQVRGFYSQMIFGESFEKPQQNATRGVSADAWAFVPCGAGCVASSEIINQTIAPAHHGASSRKITIHKAAATAPQQQSSALPFAGLRNRALANEGMYLEAGKPYEGYFFARCAAPVKLGVRLENYMTNETLAEQTFDFACGDNSSAWVKLDFTLTPKAGTQCTGIAVGSDPAIPCTRPTNEAGHACIRCDGQFVVGLYGVGSVGLDYIFLQPGAWGRVNGLPVRKTAGDTLSKMGITVMRVGGSFASVTGWPDGGGGTPPSTTSGEYYQWQYWTGKPWLRPSVGAVWNAYSGTSYSLIGGWGPFEVIDMCNALGIEPILTTTASSSPDELADLVEYCHGDASTTAMGRKRAADGHQAPYRVRFFELGNEQYNTRFVAQVAAMEKRANTLGLNGSFVYLFPDNGGLHGQDVDAAKQLGIDERIAYDVHVGAGGGIDAARSIFGRVPFSAVNLETNAGTHTHERALQEAADLNAFFSAPKEIQSRLLVRTASFCTERSGHFDAFDQGISFFLPNASWLQPPGHVHAMIARTVQDNARNVTVSSSSSSSLSSSSLSSSSSSGGAQAEANGPLSVSAQSSDKDDAFVVRIVNPFGAPIGPGGSFNLTFAVSLSQIAAAAATTCKTCTLSVLHAPDTTMANPSWAPDLVAPRDLPCKIDGTGHATAPLPLMPFSYSVVELSGCA